MALSTALWLACAPLLTAAFVGATVALWFERNDPVRFVLLAATATFALLFRARLARADGRARVLSGNSPLGCHRAPKTTEEFVDQLCSVWSRVNARPSVVGSGWGWFIGRARARDAVFTHQMQGRLGPLAFQAGTELRTVEQILRKEHGLTFWSTPTMQRISIGSCFARSCHGNSGADGKPGSYAVARVLVVDLASLETARAGARWEEYGAMKPRFDKDPGRFVVAAVEFDLARMSPNQWLQKGRVDVTPDFTTASQGLREWLTNQAVLRVLFFGSARRDLAIGVTYVPFNPEEDAYDFRRECGCCGRKLRHIDPHGCSAQCMSLQLDTCSLVCGWYEKAKREWRGVIRLSDANAFSPDPSWLGFPILALLSGTVNFELIFILPQLVAPTPRTQEFRVQKLCNALFAVYAKIWGRSELRMAGLDKGLVFVDCVMRERDAHVVVQALKPHMHLQTVALHDSKFQGDGVTDAIARAGLWRETPRAVFAMHS